MQLLQILLNGVSVGAIYAVVALGLALVYGGLRVPNFAHGAFVMVGAYLMYGAVAGLGLPFWLAIVLVVLAMALLGLVQEFAWFRALRNANVLVLILASFALYLLVQNIVLLRYGGQFSRSVPFPLSGSLSIAGARLTYQRLIVIVLAVLVVAGLTLLLNRTRLGRAIRAVAEDPDAAALTGINEGRVHQVVFALSTALAGIAGLMLASLYPIQPFLGEQELLKAFAIIIVAGKGNTAGLVLVALGLGIAEGLAVGYFPSPVIGEGLAFGVLALALMIKPEGLVSDPSAPA